MKLPKKLYLHAINENWDITYKTCFISKPEVIKLNNHLIIKGKLKERAHFLHQWLQQKGRKHLIPWLNNLSLKTNLSYNRISIRGQKTRWGSCSSQKNINLNYNLLFLKPKLVDYIIVHELCHTKYLNHSKEFWNLVAKFYPDHKELRKQLRNYKENYCYAN